MDKNKQATDWKWGQSSTNAFNVVAGFFGVVPKNLINIKDADAKKLL